MHTRNVQLCGIIAGVLLATGCDPMFNGDTGFPIASPDVNVEVNVDGPRIDLTQDTTVEQTNDQEVVVTQDPTQTQDTRVDSSVGDGTPHDGEPSDNADPCESDSDCDDDNLCTEDECDHGECVHDPVDCDDGDFCNPETGDCVECLTDAGCDGADPCTDDEFVDRECVNEPISCDDKPFLVAAWSFDGCSGSAVPDDSGNGHDAAITGAAWTNDACLGCAMEFDGLDDYLEVASSPLLECISDAITIEAMIQPQAFPVGSDTMTIVRKQVQSGPGSFILALRHTGDGIPFLSMNLKFAGNLVGLTDTSTPIPLDACTHVAGTYDGELMHLYVNGVQVASRSQSGTIDSVSTPLVIGRLAHNFSSEYFRGVIDELRIFRTPKCGDELSLMSAVLPSGRYGLACTSDPATQKIYCFGGFDGSLFFDQIVEYDPETDTLRAMSAVLGSKRNDLACAASSATGKTYCFGGYDNNGNNRVDEIIEYDPATDTLDTVSAVLPSGRSGLACAVDPTTGRIYCFGGYDGAQELSEIVEYDPETDVLDTMSAVWVPGRSLPACAASSGTGRIYCFGGDGASTAGTQIIEYDPATDTVETMSAKLPSAREALSCAEDSATGRIFCFGGLASTGLFSDILEYDPDSDTLETMSAKLPLDTDGLASSPAGPGSIYLFGGRNLSGARALNQIHRYRTSDAPECN